MFNLFKRPTETDTLEAWAKISEDIAKVALLALPVVVFGQYRIAFKFGSSLGLLLTAYVLLVLGKQIRKHRNFLSSKED